MLWPRPTCMAPRICVAYMRRALKPQWSGRKRVTTPVGSSQIMTDDWQTKRRDTSRSLP